MERDKIGEQQADASQETHATETGCEEAIAARSLILPPSPRNFKLQEVDIGEGRTCVVRLAESRDRLTLLLAAGFGTGTYCARHHRALVLAWGVVGVRGPDADKPVLGSDGKELQGMIVDGLGHVFFETLFDTIDKQVLDGMYQRIWSSLDMHPVLGVWPSLMTLVQHVVDDVCGNPHGTMQSQMKTPISKQV